MVLWFYHSQGRLGGTCLLDLDSMFYNQKLLWNCTVLHSQCMYFFSKEEMDMGGITHVMQRLFIFGNFLLRKELWSTSVPMISGRVYNFIAHKLTLALFNTIQWNLFRKVAPISLWLSLPSKAKTSNCFRTSAINIVLLNSTCCD